MLLNFQNILVIQSPYKVSPNAGLEEHKKLTWKFSITDGNTLPPDKHPQDMYPWLSDQPGVSDNDL